MKKYVYFVLLIIFIFSGLKTNAQSDFSLGFANTYIVADEGVEDGDIISFKKPSQDAGGESENIDGEEVILVRSSKAYDDQIFGIYIDSPIIVLRTNEGELPIVREGDAMVNVTTLNGQIVKGDPITSSPIEGKGQQGRGISGMTVGIAMESFDESTGEVLVLDDGKQVVKGKVRVALDIGKVQPLTVVSRGGIIGLISTLGFSILQALEAEGGAKILRYMIAALVAIVTVLVSFYTFGRNITKGIEAIGRNPVAKVQIQSMIVLNVFLIALVTIGGIILTLILINF